jgi:hypothetical protein
MINKKCDWEKMKILAIEHELPGTTPKKFRRHSIAEASTVWDLHQAGVIRELYFRTDRTEALLVLECDSVDDAQKILKALPFVRTGLITFEVIPLKEPILQYLRQNS